MLTKLTSTDNKAINPVLLKKNKGKRKRNNHQGFTQGLLLSLVDPVASSEKALLVPPRALSACIARKA